MALDLRLHLQRLELDAAYGGVDPRTGLHVVRSATLGDGIRHRRSRMAPAPAGYSDFAGRTQLHSARYPRCGCGGRRRLLAALLSDNAAADFTYQFGGAPFRLD